MVKNTGRKRGWTKLKMRHAEEKRGRAYRMVKGHKEKRVGALNKTRASEKKRGVLWIMSGT
jgi:hypothetical protein